MKYLGSGFLRKLERLSDGELISPLFLLVFAILAWIFSVPIAGLVCRDCEPDIPVANVGEFALYHALFLGIGLWTLLASAGYLYSWFHFYATDANEQRGKLTLDETQNLSHDLVSVGLGLALIFTSHIWAKKACKAGSD